MPFDTSTRLVVQDHAEPCDLCDEIIDAGQQAVSRLVTRWSARLIALHCHPECHRATDREGWGEDDWSDDDSTAVDQAKFLRGRGTVVGPCPTCHQPICKTEAVCPHCWADTAAANPAWAALTLENHT
jgi:hypothetical protein